MTIGRRIKFWRSTRGLTQVKLAEMAEISRSYLAGVECDNYNPSLETLTAIAKALNVDASDLLQGETPGGKIIEAAVEDSDLSGDELQMLERYRNASPEKRAAIMALLKSE